jgi:hypothetical protein
MVPEVFVTSNVTQQKKNVKRHRPTCLTSMGNEVNGLSCAGIYVLKNPHLHADVGGKRLLVSLALLVTSVLLLKYIRTLH